jgi:hypothetical protein
VQTRVPAESLVGTAETPPWRLSNAGRLADEPVVSPVSGPASARYTRTTQLYDRREDRVTLDEVVKINIRG